MPNIISISQQRSRQKANSTHITHSCIHPFTGYQENRKKQPKWAAIGGRSWGSWSILWVGVSVGVDMSQNYANAVWLLKYVNVVRSSLTLCSSSSSPSPCQPALSALCSTILVISHFSFVISRLSHFSLFLCLLVWCFWQILNKWESGRGRVCDGAGWVRTPAHVMQMGTLSWGRWCHAGIDGDCQQIRAKVSNKLSNCSGSWQFGYSEA